MVCDICWNKQTVTEPSAFFVPPRSAYTPQVPRLFSETLRDNVLLGMDDGGLEEAVKAAVAVAVLEDDIATLEKGLDTVVGPRGVRLSGGQIQRAAAARMFVRDAELLILDGFVECLGCGDGTEVVGAFEQGGRGAGEQRRNPPRSLSPPHPCNIPSCFASAGGFTAGG